MVPRHKRSVARLLGGVLCLCCAACHDGEPLRVWAAASLAEVLPRIAEAFPAGGSEVRFSFDGTSRLARQLEAGAPADLFFSADERFMDRLTARGIVDASWRRDLLGNRLVVVVPASAPKPGPSSLEDLIAPRFARIALAGREVPAGRYADQALEASGLLARLRPRIVRGHSVRVALAWAARGEVDAALVYATDARAEPAVREAFSIPASSHAPIVYPAALVKGAPHLGEAQRFLEFCQSDAARSVFEDAGFHVLGPLP